MTVVAAACAGEGSSGPVRGVTILKGHGCECGVGVFPERHPSPGEAGNGLRRRAGACLDLALPVLTSVRALVAGPRPDSCPGRLPGGSGERMRVGVRGPGLCSLGGLGHGERTLAGGVAGKPRPSPAI